MKETEDRLIFPSGEKKYLTESGYKKSLEPYEQQVELFSNLEAWCNHAVGILRENGYSESYDEAGEVTDDECLALIKKPRLASYGSLYKLTWIPQALLSDANVETKAADDVLRAVRKLYEAISNNDKNRIANAGIEVGIAVAVAHTEPYEVVAAYGKKCKSGSSAGGESRKESLGINGKLEQIKIENPNFSAAQAWKKLKAFAESGNPNVAVDGEIYELGIEENDDKYSDNVKVVSTYASTGTPDGRGITEATLKKKYSGIKI